MLKAGLIVISLLIYGVTHASELSSNIARASESQVNSIAKFVAQSLANDAPMQVNSVTTLTAVGFVSATKTFIYQYQTTSNPSSDNLRPRLINGVCTNEVLHALLKRSITFRYNYATTNAKHLLTLDVESRDCL